MFVWYFYRVEEGGRRRETEPAGERPPLMTVASKPPQALGEKTETVANLADKKPAIKDDVRYI
jgi:hypothetical protein